jgi:hypothetical protein
LSLGKMKGKGNKPMPEKFKRVASLVFNTPLLIEPMALDKVAGYVNARMHGGPGAGSHRSARG